MLSVTCKQYKVLDYKRIFSISDPLYSRPYRGAIKDFTLASAEISRDEKSPSAILEINYAMGESNPGDIIWTSNANPLIVSENVIAILEQNEITGWSKYDVVIYNKVQQLIDRKYFGLAISGRCGYIDYSRGTVFSKTVGIAESEHIKFAKFKDDYWDGSDLFMRNVSPEGKITMDRYCTEKVVDIFRKNKVRNIQFDPVSEQAFPVFMLKIGASERERGEIEKLLNACR